MTVFVAKKVNETISFYAVRSPQVSFAFLGSPCLESRVWWFPAPHAGGPGLHPDVSDGKSQGDPHLRAQMSLGELCGAQTTPWWPSLHCHYHSLAELRKFLLPRPSLSSATSPVQWWGGRRELFQGALVPQFLTGLTRSYSPFSRGSHRTSFPLSAGVWVTPMVGHWPTPATNPSHQLMRKEEGEFTCLTRHRTSHRIDSLLCICWIGMSEFFLTTSLSQETESMGPACFLSQRVPPAHLVTLRCGFILFSTFPSLLKTFVLVLLVVACVVSVFWDVFLDHVFQTHLNHDLWKQKFNEILTFPVGDVLWLFPHSALLYFSSLFYSVLLHF